MKNNRKYRRRFLQRPQPENKPMSLKEVYGAHLGSIGKKQEKFVRKIEGAMRRACVEFSLNEIGEKLETPVRVISDLNLSDIMHASSVLIQRSVDPECYFQNKEVISPEEYELRNKKR